MSNIFGWIGQREQREFLIQAKRHMEQVLAVVHYLQEAVQALCNRDHEGMQRLHHQLSEAEHEADLIRRDLLARLTQGLLLPPDRQDLVQLVGHMDAVADCAQGASRVLVIFRDVPADFCADLQQFAGILVIAAGHLAEGLEALVTGDAERALGACTQVETAEEEADRLKAAVLAKLFYSDLPAGTLLLMHNLIEAMENTADQTEDSADLVRVLTVLQAR